MVRPHEMPHPGSSAPLVSAEDVERNIMHHHSQILSTIEARNETMLRHLADNDQQKKQTDELKHLVDEQRRWVLFHVLLAFCCMLHRFPGPFQ